MKIESQKLNMKAKSKVGSLDNVGPGNGQTNGHKVKFNTASVNRDFSSAASLCFYLVTPLGGVGA